MALRKQNKKRKNSNIGSSFLPTESHVGDKEYFSFWSKTGLFDDPNIAELFAMIEEAKHNTVVPEIPTKRMKKETVDQSLCVPMNGNEVAKNNGDGGDNDDCDRKTVTILRDQSIPMNDNEVANKNGDNNVDGGNDHYCDRKTEQIIDHSTSVLPVPKGQKSNDVVRTPDEKDQKDSIVNLKPDKKRHFSTDILKYFSVVSELNRDVCQRSLDYLSEFKTTNILQKFFTVIEKEENSESKSQKGDILFKREGH